MDKQVDSTSLDGERPWLQLPAYSETDGSNAEFEMVNAPRSPTQQTYMTAEEEKAYLAGQEQSEIPRGLPTNTHVQVSEARIEQHHITRSTACNIHEQPLRRDTSTSIISRGLYVPSCRGNVSSGFPYPEMLNTYGVSAEEWGRFTSEITQAAKLSSKDWTVTVGASVATLCVSGVILGWLGLIPACFVGHRLRRSAEKKNLRAARDIGDLETKLFKWNETCFAPKGFLVRLDLPGDESSDLDRMDVFTPKKRERKCAGCGYDRATSCKSEGKRARKAEKRAERCKRKTAKRGRIAILPLEGFNRFRTEQLANGPEDINRTDSPIAEKELQLGGSPDT